MREIGEALEQIGLVLVITIERPEDIVSLAQVLLAGGVQCAEITFRTAAAEESIRRIAQDAPLCWLVRAPSRRRNRQKRQLKLAHATSSRRASTLRFGGVRMLKALSGIEGRIASLRRDSG